MKTQFVEASWRQKVLYGAFKWAVCLIVALPYLQSAYICPPETHQAGAVAGACFYAYENLVPVFGLLLFAITPWPLLGATVAFVAGHVMAGLPNSPFTLGVLTDQFPGSLIRQLGVPAPGGIFFLRVELLVVLAWAVAETALRAVARARR